MAGLLDQTAWSAVFKPGLTALGHHWLLYDVEKNLLGRTKTRRRGGLRTAAVLTGLSTKGDVRADVLDTAGNQVVELFSSNERDNKHVVVSSPGGTKLAVVRRVPNEGFHFEDSAGARIGGIPLGAEVEEPWELQDSDANKLGVLTREPATAARGTTLTDVALGWGDEPTASDFQATMHLGFAFSNIYGVSLESPPESEPLRTIAVLMPVIAGVAY